MITRINQLLAALPAELRTIGERIYQIDVMRGQTLPPPSMLPWVAEHFGDAAQVREQTIVKITNRLTLEAALFNPLRARRPHAGGGDNDAALERWIARELAEHDPFRDPERDTTADPFGRIYGQHCISASNVAKYDGWHGLVIFNDPHPLHFGPAQLADFLDVALRWITAAQAYDPAAIYPVITWNCLPKSGATLMHGHMQVALTRGMHFARIEAWRRAAEHYYSTYGRHYFSDLYGLHAGLGLAWPSSPHTHAMIHLAPTRNRELLIVAPTRAAGREDVLNAAREIAGPLAAWLGQNIGRHGMRAFNAAIALPPLASTAEDWRATPVVARVGDRGNPLANRSDVGAMELFVASCITADPFEVAAQLHIPAPDPAGCDTPSQV